jgi:hypothetical protein
MGYTAAQGIAEYKGWTAAGDDLSADPPSGTTIVQPSTGLTVPYNGNGGERHMIDFVVSSSDNSPSDGDFDDLQFSCMGTRSVTTASHDCSGNMNWAWDPVCDCNGADCATAAQANTNWGNASSNVTQPRYKAYQGLRFLRMINALQSSGYAASICAASFEPAIIGIVKKIKSVLGAQCFTGSVQTFSDNTSNCIIVETIPASAINSATSITTQGACGTLGLCTPGDTTCNRSPLSNFQTESVDQAASQITLDVNAGGSVVQKLTAQVDPTSGNVVIQPDGGAEQLVCEVPQLTGTDVTQCASDPNYVLPGSILSGWCYANSAAALAAYGCQAGTGELRFLGKVTTQGSGSELYTVCITRIGGGTDAGAAE